jgi:hypothetical protein
MNRGPLIAGGVVLVVILIAAGALVKPRVATPQKEAAVKTLVEPEQTRSTRVGHINSGFESPAPISTPHKVTVPGAATTHTVTQSHPLTGFVVDDFRSWTAIPKQYHAEGLRVADGGLQLDDVGSSESRTGVLQSPPMELWQPALSAPAEKNSMPDDCEVHAQISLSSDGRSWTNWKAIEHHVRPDGHQVVPSEPPPWAGSRPAQQALASNESQTSGPYIRYRLTLTSQSSASPLIQDLRIWRNSQLNSD